MGSILEFLAEVITDIIERVAAGAREAGRDPFEAELWFTTPSSVDADRDKAIEHIHASVSSILNRSIRFGLEGNNVPSRFQAKIAEYVEGYELYDHVLQAGRNPKRMTELGLTEYPLERFTLAMNVNDWIERIAELSFCTEAVRIRMEAMMPVTAIHNGGPCPVRVSGKHSPTRQRYCARSALPGTRP